MKIPANFNLPGFLLSRSFNLMPLMQNGLQYKGVTQRCLIREQKAQYNIILWSKKKQEVYTSC